MRPARREDVNGSILRVVQEQDLRRCGNRGLADAAQPVCQLDGGASEAPEVTVVILVQPHVHAALLPARHRQRFMQRPGIALHRIPILGVHEQYSGPPLRRSSQVQLWEERVSALQRLIGKVHKVRKYSSSSRAKVECRVIVMMRFVKHVLLVAQSLRKVKVLYRNLHDTGCSLPHCVDGLVLITRPTAECCLGVSGRVLTRTASATCFKLRLSGWAEQVLLNCLNFSFSHEPLEVHHPWVSAQHLGGELCERLPGQDWHEGPVQVERAPGSGKVISS
mmetsp:Transcript_21692/g.60193  ORF Transcript_21692/g.60193 Transcript_21692/m.60193 type:complete len:278 (+) Transcript_21692:407-1240(+)